MYTINPKSASLKSEVSIRWEGNSHEIIKTFPPDVRGNLGADLRRLQEGLPPLDSKAMPGVGQGVFELRDQDVDAWYRVLYLKKRGDTIHVLHCFKKKSKKTSRPDIEIANKRLAGVSKKLAEEERDAKRKKTGGARDKR